MRQPEDGHQHTILRIDDAMGHGWIVIAVLILLIFIGVFSMAVLDGADQMDLAKKKCPNGFDLAPVASGYRGSRSYVEVRCR